MKKPDGGGISVIEELLKFAQVFRIQTCGKQKKEKFPTAKWGLNMLSACGYTEYLLWHRMMKWKPSRGNTVILEDGMVSWV